VETDKAMTLEDPQIKNPFSNVTQPKFFSVTLSQNLFYPLSEEMFTKEVAKTPDEDDRFFGTHIIEARDTLRRLFKKRAND